MCTKGRNYYNARCEGGEATTTPEKKEENKRCLSFLYVGKVSARERARET